MIKLIEEIYYWTYRTMLLSYPTRNGAEFYAMCGLIVPSYALLLVIIFFVDYFLGLNIYALYIELIYSSGRFFAIFLVVFPFIILWFINYLMIFKKLTPSFSEARKQYIRMRGKLKFSKTIDDILTFLCFTVLIPIYISMLINNRSSSFRRIKKRCGDLSPRRKVIGKCFTVLYYLVSISVALIFYLT